MAKARVLVVDDEESMRYFLVRSMKREGYEVATAASGEEAVARAEVEPFDLFLLDLRLPGMDGLEVLSRLRTLRPSAPVIVMTGYGTVERALEAMRKGAADFVAKPVEIAQILAKAAEALGRTAPPPDAPPTEAAGRTAAPRPLSAYLIETAKERGVQVSAAGAGDLSLRAATKVFETLYFAELLERTGGNVSVAARIAGISRPSLHRRIRELGIDMARLRR